MTCRRRAADGDVLLVMVFDKLTECRHVAARVAPRPHFPCGQYISSHKRKLLAEYCRSQQLVSVPPSPEANC